MNEALMKKPVWQMTGEELYALLNGNGKTAPEQDTKSEIHHVYGIPGIAKLFNCSIPTANRIKASGKIDGAIKQIGRKIIVDADLALELAGKKNGGRR
jgi:hypothetical protein